MNGTPLRLIIAGVIEAASIALLAGHFSRVLRLQWPIAVLLSISVMASGACFTAYWLDKRRAVRNGPRIRERTLNLMELAGGWPGAIFAQHLFRHKTQKLSYRVRFWTMVALHSALIVYVVYLLVRPASG